MDEDFEGPWDFNDFIVDNDSEEEEVEDSDA